MSVIIQGDQLRALRIGQIASKAQALSAATLPIFTIAGGRVLITAFYGVVTTAITATGGTLALQTNPTVGTTSTIVQATDLGTTDSAIGDIIGTRDQGDGTTDFAINQFALEGLVVATGQLEVVGATAINGAATFYAGWVPLDNGATLVAA